MPKFKFDFAISYAGEDRSVAESVAKSLTNYGASVYYAPRFQSKLLGKRMSREFGKAFGPQTRFFMPIISEHYVRKDYPQYEWEIALAESKKRDKEFVLPLRLDDTPIVGLPPDTAFLDLRHLSVESAVQVLVGKLPAQRQLWPREWVATFGVVMEELFESGQLPETAPSDYPSLCDWLIEDLLTKLGTQGIEDLEFLEDDRDGETLSVRVGFSWPDKRKPISVHGGSWWETLEILPHKQVYG